MITQPSPPQGWVWSPKQTWLHSMLGDSPWLRWSTSLPQKQAYPDSIPASCKTQKELCKSLQQQFKTNFGQRFHNAIHYKRIWHGCQWGKHWRSLRTEGTNFCVIKMRIWAFLYTKNINKGSFFHKIIHDYITTLQRNKTSFQMHNTFK